MKIPGQGIVGREALREAAAQPDLRQVMDLVRAAINAKINAASPEGNRKWFDVEAFYADHMVIEFDGRCWSYPYTIAATTVTLGEATEVVETYAPLKEAAAVDLRMIEAEGAAVGVAWEADIICAGLAATSNIFYTDALLRESAALFDGARIFVKGDIEHLKGGGKDVRQLVGWVDSPRFVEGATADTGRTVATIQLPGLPEETRTLLVEAVKAGRTNLVGLSIDAVGASKRQQRGGKSVKVATRISKVNSVDLIVEPGAGGGLVRLVEAADPNHQEDADMALKERMLEAIKAKNPAKAATIDLATISDEDLETAYREAVTPAITAATDIKGFATLDDLRMIEARASARVKIAESTLPAAAKDKLRADFEARERFVEADIDAAIKGEREYLARFTESGHVRMGGLDIEITEPRHTVIADMLDAFFDPKHKNHRSVHSFKECYREITGDDRVTGRLESCDPVRLREALGETAFRESLDSTSFSNVLGSSITRRLVADYREMGQYDVWRQLVQTVPVGDFRTNERTRFGGYGDLPAVAEGDPYAALASPTDEKATYAVTKRGGTEDVTLEMVKNDDVGTIRRIPTKLSRAAKRTLAKFALDFLRTNPTIYDNVALFHANHGNLGAAALDAASLAAGRLAMLKQTELNSADRIGVGAKHLWVPADLEEAAVNLFSRNTNNDKTFVQTLSLMVMPVWYWTDANDWAMSADYNDIPTIELGFLDGAEEPELFVQDTPTVGSVFSHDKLTYKIRHIYGGNVLDYRGLYKAVVA